MSNKLGYAIAASAATLAMGAGVAWASWPMGLAAGSRGYTVSATVPRPASIHASCAPGFRTAQISWSAVPYAQSYSVSAYIDGLGPVAIGTSTSTSLTYTANGSGTDTFLVRANAGSWTSSVTGPSNPIQFTNTGKGCR